jgi:hypothetical protein
MPILPLSVANCAISIFKSFWQYGGASRGAALSAHLLLYAAALTKISPFSQ